MGAHRPGRRGQTLAKGLAFAVRLAPRAGLQLAVTSPDGTLHALTGAASIAHHHDQAHAATEASAPVRLLRADRPALDLGPWLAARVCALCGYRDLFFFNGGDGDGRRFDLLDWSAAWPRCWTSGSAMTGACPRWTCRPPTGPPPSPRCSRRFARWLGRSTASTARC